jgi:hypothetical protein
VTFKPYPFRLGLTFYRWGLVYKVRGIHRVLGRKES